MAGFATTIAALGDTAATTLKGFLSSKLMPETSVAGCCTRAMSIFSFASGEQLMLDQF